MKKRRYKSYHLVIIPYDKIQGKDYYFTVKTLKLLTFMAVFLIATFATLITLHTRNFYRIRLTLYPTLSKNSILLKENTEFKDEKTNLETVIDSLTDQLFAERAVHHERLKSLNVKAEKVKKFAESLRIMVGFKLEPKDAQPPGLGGPITEEKDDFLIMEEVASEEINAAFNKAEKTLFRKFASSREQLKKLWKHFENKSSIIEGTPELQPVPGRILSGFGYRIGPFTGREEFHQGVDIPAVTGTKIKAPADGVVVFVGRKGGYGKVLIIDHGNNYKTVYGHLRAFDVAVGDRVKKGDYIGEVGNTGKSTGSHLHYEVKLNNVVVDPANYFKSIEERKREFDDSKRPDMDQ
ncbi:MAG: M23 family metallopeptidase [Candidatus Cloacimonadota bacterium]|nr:MAG: M23 family metallopeptidase [Candidatus Cloacimonadota bacterium]